MCTSLDTGPSLNPKLVMEANEVAKNKDYIPWPD